MQKRIVNCIIILLLFFVVPSACAQQTFTAGELMITLDNNGYFKEIRNRSTGKNYLYADTTAPLLTLVSNGQRYLPEALSKDKTGKLIRLFYDKHAIHADVRITNKQTHLVFEIVSAGPADKIEAVIWGPVPTTISKTVGEVIGVVRDEEVAIGMQVLNIKTLGGNYQNNEGSYWGRGLAAISTEWGSLLNAYTINRDRDRVIDGWNGQFRNMPVKRMPGETVAGSKIALFTCKEPSTLDYIEKIELAEGLPHPTIKGIWFKRSAIFGRSYLISSFNEKEIDEMVAYTKRAGLISLYHEGPFQSWGHFILNKEQFPGGRVGLKQCADKAHKAGLYLGIHVLSNFINTNDPYVTPVPDQRLSATGSSLLVKAINASQNEMEIASSEYFLLAPSNHLRTIRIEKELLQYDSVTKESPYKLLGCKRGAFGTTASAHSANKTVFKLLDHDYGVFFPNIDMQKEVARNFANLLNETGVDHFDFDGFEGGVGTGEGDYGVELFSKIVFDHVKRDVLYGTSISKSFYWHIGSYYNWGEPWYGGFKESMQQYRIDNQGLFDRNFMPHMLGWYLLTEKTSMEDMEWMLARSAGYNAGFAMVASPAALRKNPNSGILLDAIREWETARNGKAFSREQQELLKDPKTEFHLEKTGEGQWMLTRFSATEPKKVLSAEKITIHQ